MYTVLWEVVRRLKADPLAGPSDSKPLAMTILRMQHEGRRRNREDDANDGNTAAYAASQAIERALSRELPVKLQGIVTNDGKPADQERFAKTGTLAALLGGQPMRFRMEGTLDKIAILTYITKPSDSHPLFSDAQGQLFISRTYLAERTADGSATLRVDRMLSRLVDSVKDFKTPHAILEEVARLEREGFTHIALLSHHFGNRHIGRAAERHSPHATNEFLDGAAKRFPGVHLYPLRRDIFPATRLRRRTSMESGFEVTNFEDHRKMYSDGAADVLRSLLPIYTFATLAVVSEEHRPQSGFCTYFFDLRPVSSTPN